jgi:hypothetical protein
MATGRGEKKRRKNQTKEGNKYLLGQSMATGSSNNANRIHGTESSK